MGVQSHSVHGTRPAPEGVGGRSRIGHGPARHRVVTCAAVAVLGLALTAAGAAPSQAVAFVYVTNMFSDNVSQYDVGSGGLLAPLSPPTMAAGRGPQGVAVRPTSSESK